MKCVAIGDILLPSHAFAEAVKGQPWVEEFDCFDWEVTKDRAKTRAIVRKMETEGYSAFIPTAEELDRLRDADVLMTHL